MNTNQLKIFLSVCDLGSFKRAAEQNYVSQRAVSKQMKRLEDELNAQLFIREKNKIKLTAAGKFFAGRAKAVLNTLNDTSQHLSSMNSRQEQINVGYFSPFDAYLLRKAFFNLKNKINFFISEEGVEHLVSDVLMGNLDCAFVMDNYGFNYQFPRMGLAAQEVFSDKMIIGVSEDLTTADTVSLDLIRSFPIVYYSNEESEYLKKAFTQSLSKDINDFNIHRVFSYEQMQMLVATGQALSFYPQKLSAMIATSSDHIQYLPIRGVSDQEFQFKLIYRNANKNPAVQELVRFYRNTR